MKHYEKMLEMGCFNRLDLIELTGSPAAASSVIYDYQKRGLIQRVKRDFYVAISLESRQPVLSRYQIGANLFPDACISHHSAFEVYGYSNQVYYECYVATNSRFADFEYEGITYRRIEKKLNTDVVQEGKLRVTSLEQTVVDSIRDCEKIAGMEEVLRCLAAVPGLKEDKLLECLAANNNGFLYQKCGYILEELNDGYHLSTSFFEECQKHCSQARRYLTREPWEMEYNDRWGLYVPSVSWVIRKGVPDYDEFW